MGLSRSWVRFLQSSQRCSGGDGWPPGRPDQSCRDDVFPQRPACAPGWAAGASRLAASGRQGQAQRGGTQRLGLLRLRVVGKTLKVQAVQRVFAAEHPGELCTGACRGSKLCNQGMGRLSKGGAPTTRLAVLLEGAGTHRRGRSFEPGSTAGPARHTRGCGQRAWWGARSPTAGAGSIAQGPPQSRQWRLSWLRRPPAGHGSGTGRAAGRQAASGGCCKVHRRGLQAHSRVQR